MVWTWGNPSNSTLKCPIILAHMHEQSVNHISLRKGLNYWWMLQCITNPTIRRLTYIYIYMWFVHLTQKAVSHQAIQTVKSLCCGKSKVLLSSAGFTMVVVLVCHWLEGVGLHSQLKDWNNKFLSSNILSFHPHYCIYCWFGAVNQKENTFLLFHDGHMYICDKAFQQTVKYVCLNLNNITCSKQYCYLWITVMQNN